MNNPRAESDGKFLYQLVVRPGRATADRLKCLDMKWIISRAAAELEKSNNWPTVDSLLAAAYKGPGETPQGKNAGTAGKNAAAAKARKKKEAAKARKKAAKALAKGKAVPAGADHPDDPEDLLVAILQLPPAIGSVCGGDDNERVQLTALGLLLAGTTSRSAKFLAKMCHICSEKKMYQPGPKVEKRLEELVTELAPQESDFPELVRVTAPLVPGVTMSDDPHSGKSLVVHRSALAYWDTGADPKELKKALKTQVENQLKLKKKKRHQRLWKWVQLLLALIFAGQWVNETTIDPAPSWIPGNESPARKPCTGPERNGQAPVAGDKDYGYLAALLNTYATQFGSYTTLLWQVPALSLTAQSFLMMIALGGGNSNLARLIASALSAVIAITSISLMHNQRGHAINHGELALRVSRRLGLAEDFGALAINDAKPEFTDAESVWVGWDRHIYHVWKICLGLFIVADVVVFLLVLIRLVIHLVHPDVSTGQWWL